MLEELWKKSVTQSSYIYHVCLLYDEKDADLNCQIDKSNSLKLFSAITHRSYFSFFINVVLRGKNLLFAVTLLQNRL